MPIGIIGRRYKTMFRLLEDIVMSIPHDRHALHLFQSKPECYLGGYSLQHGGALTPYYNAKKVKLIFNYSPYWLRSKQDCHLVNFLVVSFGLPAFARY